MSQLDYGPMRDGVPYDPAPGGGTVTTLELFATRGRTGTPITIGSTATVRAGVYRFTIADEVVPAGRYWARITWTATAGGIPQVDDQVAPVDLPIREDLAVSPETLAVKLGVTLPLGDDQRGQLADAILDAQSDVVAYLGREILPQLYTERRIWPLGGALGPLAHQPVHEILGEVEELDENNIGTGYWLLTYRAGLDARGDVALRPIRRLIAAHAARSDEAVTLWASAGAGAATDGTGAKRIRSLSTEGQSASYDYGRPGDTNTGSGSGSRVDDAVGGPVRWESLDRWRLRGRRVFQRSGGQGAVQSVTIGL